MNAQRLINMALRMLMRHGSAYLARRGQATQPMSPEEKAQSKSAREVSRRARDAARLTRRIGR